MPRLRRTKKSHGSFAESTAAERWRRRWRRRRRTSAWGAECWGKTGKRSRRPFRPVVGRRPRRSRRAEVNLINARTHVSWVVFIQVGKHYMLSLSPAVAIWKDGRISIEITSLSEIARSTLHVCTNLYVQWVETDQSNFRIYPMDIHFSHVSWYYANAFCGCLYGCWWMLDRLISTHP